MPVKYKIYPSLLDKFTKLLDSDIEAEEFWNIDSETGEYKRTAQEIYEKHEKELIDSINRVPHEPIEAADKGTAFNEIVDCLIEHRQSNNAKLTISKVFNVEEGSVDMSGEPIKRYVIALKAEINGFIFLFDVSMCNEVAKYFSGALCQHFTKATLQTQYGDVDLYGYMDEWIMGKIFDIKTTSSYDFGKFARSWQKDVYPYCAIESGEATEINEFEYTVIVLSKPSLRTPIISGKMYQEVYTYIHEQATERLRNICERFIEWIESKREFITDKKIFALE